MRKQLTEAMIEKLNAPASGRLEIFDSIVPGLALRVTPNGAKSFTVRGRIKGRSGAIRVTIGDATAVKLSDAREQASDVLKGMRKGNDPRQEIRLQKIAAEKAETLEFSATVESFIEKHAKKETRSWRETESLFKHHVTPHWRKRLLSEITREDVVRLLDRVEEQVSVYRANRVLAAIRKLMNWSVLRGLTTHSPIVAGMARKGERARTRFLSFYEIGIVWLAAERMGEPFGPLFRFLLATGQRRSEATGARWASLDLTHERLWTLTADEVKADREHLVPLSDLALEILNGRPRIDDPKTNEPVYAFTTLGCAPVSAGGKAKRHLDAEIMRILRERAEARGEEPRKIKSLPEWRIHDLRRTVATHLEDALGVPPHIVGSLLNHSPRSYKGVTAVYTRGDLIFERRRAITAWSRLLRLLIGREGAAVWKSIEKIMRPETEADAAMTAEFRRIIQADEATWVKYLKGIERSSTRNRLKAA